MVRLSYRAMTPNVSASRTTKATVLNGISVPHLSRTSEHLMISPGPSIIPDTYCVKILHGA
ncbi:hypothetical protein NITHO_3970007 [Nitrolancea hollandica Lb]|uniref:Uncharacterized protein n=1 Tax=Nitrolancea hollandica Lb TaxID=1129897 RepID=I4EJD7_9BACT|nr:hypothetical protein NITHO_3970007 [Nitrolancea hollandica Lb]